MAASVARGLHWLAIAAAGPATTELARLTEARLREFASTNTRRAHRRDLLTWLGWCAGRDLHPLTARRVDVAEYPDALRVQPGPARPRRRPRAGQHRPAAGAVSSWYTYLQPAPIEVLAQLPDGAP